MLTINGDRLVSLVNSDPEFRLSARHWNGTVGLNLGSNTLLLTFKDGELVTAAPTDISLVAIRLTASEDDWSEFFKSKPKPFYQGMLPAVARQGFVLEGDVEMWTAYYGALSRVLTLVRQALRQ
jgi:hypothetical protein